MREIKSCIINLPRHLKSAVQNLFRNGAMSLSSIISVSITLTLIMIVVCIGINIADITYNIEDNITIYAQVNRDLSDKQAELIQPLIENIEGVKNVEFSSKDQELDILIDSLADDEEGKQLFESYREDNPLGAAFTIEVNDPKQLEAIAQEIAQIEYIKEVRSGEQATSSMLTTLEMIRNGGLLFIAGLIAIALFMIINTIKMAIIHRKVEVEIMRVVGASNMYIRLPFMLEGALIGLIGSIVPILLLIFGYDYIYTEIIPLIPTLFTLRPPVPFIYELSVCIGLVGTLVGFIASIIPISKYLKF